MNSMNRISMPCSRETAERHDLFLRDAANRDGIETDFFEADFLGGENALEHLFESLAAGDFKERFRTQAVEADIQSFQAGPTQGAGLLSQQHAVGRHGDVAHAGHPREHLHQHAQIVANQRLTARQPDLVDAHLGHDAHEAGDLLEIEQFTPRLEAHVLGGHAVETANVATIRHAHAQIRVHPAKAVDERFAAIHGVPIHFFRQAGYSFFNRPVA